MTANEWIKINVPKGKAALSMDAVEILIKLAWEKAVESQREQMLECGWKPPIEIQGPYDIP